MGTCSGGLGRDMVKLSEARREYRNIELSLLLTQGELFLQRLSISRKSVRPIREGRTTPHSLENRRERQPQSSIRRSVRPCSRYRAAGQLHLRRRAAAGRSGVRSGGAATRGRANQPGRRGPLRSLGSGVKRTRQIVGCLLPHSSRSIFSTQRSLPQTRAPTAAPRCSCKKSRRPPRCSSSTLVSRI